MKRKGINSRNKGNTYERHIAKMFSKWTGMHLTRSPSSGGWNKTGDITPKEPEDMVNFPFNVELKKREKWSLSELITGHHKQTGIISWWKQSLRDSKISGRIPVLIFTKNNDKDYCCLDSDTFKKIGLDRKKINYMRFKGLRFFRLSDLLEIKYEIVLKGLKGWKENGNTK